MDNKQQEILNAAAVIYANGTMTKEGAVNTAFDMFNLVDQKMKSFNSSLREYIRYKTPTGYASFMKYSEFVESDPKTISNILVELEDGNFGSPQYTSDNKFKLYKKSEAIKLSKD